MSGIKEILKKFGRAVSGAGKTLVVGRRWQYGMNNFVVIFIALFFVIFLYLLAGRHHHRIDLTENKKYALSEQTVQILDRLEKEDKKVKMTAFYRPGDQFKMRVTELLEEFEYKTDRLEVEFIDADLLISKAREYDIKDSRYGVIVLEMDGKRIDIPRREIIAMKMSSYQRTEEFTGEQAITSGLAKLFKEVQSLYFVRGHAERSLGSYDNDGIYFLKDILEKENFDVKELTLLTLEEIPLDCDILVFAGPTKHISGPEWKVVEDYISRGGALFYMVEKHGVNGQAKFLSGLGLDIIEGSAFETDRGHLFPYDFRIVLPDIRQHDITRKLISSNLPVGLENAISFKYDGQKDRFYGSVLLETTEDSWAEQDLPIKQDFSANKYDPKRETKGPLQLAFALTGKQTRGKITPGFKPARIVVVGDSDITSRKMLEIPGEEDFLLNVLAWLGGEEGQITIRPKDDKRHPVFMTQSQSTFVHYFVMVFCPLMILGTGVVVWFRRRSL